MNDTLPAWTEAPWLRAPVTSTHLTFRAKLRRSPVVADLHRGWQYSLAVFGVFGLLFALLLVARGAVVLADMLAVTP